MQAISPTLTIAQAGKPEPQTLIFGLTAAKVEKIAYAIFTALAFGVAAILITMTLVSSAIVPTFLALPLLTAAGLAVWKILTIKDYNNPKQLATFQKAAETASLLETFEAHGATNMVRYQIPITPNLEPLTLMEAIALHEALHKAYVKLGDDSQLLYTGLENEQATHLQDKWAAVNKRLMNICELFKPESTFDIETVNAHGILTKEEYPALKKAKEDYDTACAELEKNLAAIAAKQEGNTAHEQQERKATFQQYLAHIHQEYQAAVGDDNT